MMNLLIKAIHRLTRGLKDSLGPNMKTIHLVTVLGVFAAVSSTPVPAWAAETDGVAVAIVYDTSGSMKEQVRDGAGNLTPKYVIANKAVNSIVKQLQAYSRPLDFQHRADGDVGQCPCMATRKLDMLQAS